MLPCLCRGATSLSPGGSQDKLTPRRTKTVAFPHRFGRFGLPNKTFTRRLLGNMREGEVFDDLEKLLWLDGFCDVGIHADFDAPLFVAFHGVGGHGHD